MAGTGVTRRMEAVGELLLRHLTLDGLPTIAQHASGHRSRVGVFRGRPAPKLKLKARLELIRPLADDRHFGVREWAWMAVRPHLAANIGHAIKSLAPWVKAKSPNVRRFAVESTRPRGVWCLAHRVAEAKPGTRPATARTAQRRPHEVRSRFRLELAERRREESTGLGTATLRTLGGRVRVRRDRPDLPASGAEGNGMWEEEGES